jgi:NitT/TauT family transport system substrate-binding protein
MASPEFLKREPDVVARFTRAAYRTQRWMTGRGATEVAEAAASHFSEVPRARLVRIMERYLRQDTWPRDPVIRRETYQYLQKILIDGGLIRRPQPYESIVDTAFASAVVREGGAA